VINDKSTTTSKYKVELKEHADGEVRYMEDLADKPNVALAMLEMQKLKITQQQE